MQSKDKERGGKINILEKPTNPEQGCKFPYGSVTSLGCAGPHQATYKRGDASDH